MLFFSLAFGELFTRVARNDSKPSINLRARWECELFALGLLVLPFSPRSFKGQQAQALRLFVPFSDHLVRGPCGSLAGVHPWSLCIRYPHYSILDKIASCSFQYRAGSGSRCEACRLSGLVWLVVFLSLSDAGCGGWLLDSQPGIMVIIIIILWDRSKTNLWAGTKDEFGLDSTADRYYTATTRTKLDRPTDSRRRGASKGKARARRQGQARGRAGADLAAPHSGSQLG